MAAKKYPSAGNMITQWVSNVKDYSSQYNESWGARQVIGAPTVYPRHGDIQGAWAHQSRKSKTEYIELEFPKEVYIEEIDIYETYHSGAVVAIYAKLPNANWHEIYKVKKPTCLPSSRIFKPAIQKPKFKCKEVKLVLNCSASPGWCEIDAVQISGWNYDCPSTESDMSALTQWVSNVKAFSSQYGEPWGARQVIGPPKVYPKHGDIRGAWAHRSSRSNHEYIELEFPQEVYIEEMDIYETYNSGAVVAIYAKLPSSDWHEIYRVNQPTTIPCSRIFQPTIQKPKFKSKEIKLVLNCSASPSWCEIDAVELKGRNYLYSPPPGLESLASDLSTLVNSDCFSDVTFYVDGQQIKAHKNILVSRSSYFRAMFCGGLAESSKDQVKFPHITAESFLAMLQYIYTNSIKNTTSIKALTELARVSDRFSMDALQQICNHRLCQGINDSNVIATYIEAVEELPVLENVKELCLDYISYHMKTVCTSPDFCNLSQEMMLEIVQKTTSRLSIN